MIGRWTTWAPLLAFAILLGLVATRIGKTEPPLPSPLVGKPLPEFALQRLDGQGTLTPEAFKGRAVVLNVFGSWCVACIEEHPVLLEASKSAEIVGIAWRDDPVRTEEWLDRRGNPYSVVGLDPDSRAAIDLGVTGAPESFVIAPDGRVALKITGIITPEIWRNQVAPLLERLK
jgi:cytochrome c biogenesis protein CcmG, thiol:disulfide interchange protein DsbE